LFQHPSSQVKRGIGQLALDPIGFHPMVLGCFFGRLSLGGLLVQALSPNLLVNPFPLDTLTPQLLLEELPLELISR
jgi:hypothetical protein